MTAALAPVPDSFAPTVAAPRRGLAGWWHDTRILTRRNVLHIRREPFQLSDVTIQPVMFCLLFVYVFGAATVIPGGTYADFVVAGILILNLTTGSVGSAVGIAQDLQTGVIDRFRTLPMSPSAVLFGRSFSDLSAAALAATLVGLTGLVVGWRPDSSVLEVAAGFAIALGFAYACSWGSQCLGLWISDAEGAQGFAFVIFFPISFISNAFVPTQGMPGWMQDFANWNPVSAVTAAVRDLWGNPNPSASIDAWPMQHPVPAALIWTVVLVAIFIPLATHLYQSKTTD